MIALIMLTTETPEVCCCSIVLIIAVISVIAVKANKNSHQGSSSDGIVTTGGISISRPPLSHSIFQTYVFSELKAFDDISMEVFTIEMQGSIKAPSNNCPILKTITLFDITKGEDDQQPVLCSLDSLQYQNTMAFFSSNVDILPFAMSLISDWQPILSVPIETLTFPARGERLLLFTLSLTAANGTVLVKSQSRISYTNTQPGYIDNMKSRLRAAELAVKLAVSVSAVDGSFAGTEGGVVREWIKKRIASSTESQREQVKEKLNNAVEAAMTASISAGADDLIHLCNDLIEMSPIPAASMGDKYDILELCLKVASADGTAMDAELDLVNSLADSLGVNRDRFRTMTEKILPVSIHETEDVNKILGIDPAWTREKKRKHLRKENRKWRALATHSDPEKQKQASQMQELIAKEMALLENSDEDG